ncbi:MAG: 2-dehydro-3-deoxy-D-gluconate 5-dehydrogenase KduD [Miniphocaeibacter sp.]|uniref:2-dehydro-3-deoxy-D-gluconate 5-dehydrogenase KduD n=1 Tax=Miniphocaeibacter sp. TaxID=3100973 RepID=UPI0017FA9B6C|nr:2-dehydro-3-deoxy-D-gluconate 5-dehydrogenase KduD [Gallicola sp.]
MELKEFNKDLFNLEGKVAIVTGGCTGLGQAYSYALASCGADIVVTSHRIPSDETKDLIEGLGRKLLVVQCDLSTEEGRNKLVESTLKEFGKIDILVNNAGTIKRAPLLEHPDEYWETVIDLNLNSLYYLGKRVAKEMVDQGGGKIINIASMLSYQGGKFVPGYAASKHGVVGLTQSFCNELAGLNVQVNAVAPGYVITNNTAPILENEERKESISARIPAGKWANPIDIAGAVVFLASGASDYVNGIVIPVDGGWLAS